MKWSDSSVNVYQYQRVSGECSAIFICTASTRRGISYLEGYVERQQQIAEDARRIEYVSPSWQQYSRR